MKRCSLLTFLLFFLLQISSSAQDFNWNHNQENNNKATSAFSLGNGKWLVGIRIKRNNINPNDTDVGIIHLVDSTGSLWSDDNRNQISGNTRIESFLKSGNKVFVLIRTINYTYIVSYLLKENSMEFIDFIQLDYGKLVDKIELLPNGKIIGVGSEVTTFFGKGYWTVISQNLVQEYENFSYQGRLNEVLLFEDSTFILGGLINDTIDYGMKIFDLDYNELESFLPNDFLSKSVQTDNGEIFITKSRRIYKLNNVFEVDTFIHLSSIETLVDFEADGNSLYVLIEDNDETNMILEYDENLSLVDTHFVKIPYFSIERIYVQHDTFIVVGELKPLLSTQGLSDAYPTSTACFYSFVKNENSNFVNNNLQIENVRVHSFVREKDCLPHLNKYNLLMKIVEVYVVNKGDIPIEEFHLNIRAVGLDYCQLFIPDRKFYEQEKKVSNIMLMPDDTLKVIFQGMKFPQFILDSAEVNLCVWATAVNQKIDIDLSDNKMCDEFDLIQNEYIEAPIVSPEENRFLLYPNPSSDRVAVSLKDVPVEASQVEFFDVVGRRIQYYWIAPRASFKEIDISNLPEGLYFVRVKNDLMKATIRFYKN